MDTAPTPTSQTASHHIRVGSHAHDVGTPVLAGVHEDALWRSLTSRVTDRDAGLAEGDGFVVGGLSLPASDGIEAPTSQLYERIFAATEGMHLCRVWHFVPRINLPDTSGLETYRMFCHARAEAFARRYPHATPAALPAASAVGTDSNQLTAIFAAHVRKPVNVENPLQVSAYHYPARYGPKAPSFSRASVVPLSAVQGHLFISGTAAIRGHETIAPGDTPGQLEVTLENLATIAEAAGLPAPLHHRLLPSKQVRVYLRNAADLPQVQRRLEKELLHPGDSCSYVRSDICRSDLTVEIEVTLLHAPLKPPAASEV